MIYPEVFSFAQSSLYYAFKNSDGMGQGIVILLFVFSVFTWTLMLEKGISLRRHGTGYRHPAVCIFCFYMDIDA